MTTPSSRASPGSFPSIAFIGGGNMCSAIVGGLVRQGIPAERITVVEPFEAARQRLREQFDVRLLASASSALDGVAMVVWAIKPQAFHDAATAVAPYTPHALHLSVAAGIRTGSMAQWLGTEHIVRAMPNTPALVGSGMTGLFARAGVSDVQKLLVEQVIGATGQFLWVQREAHLDAVTALSGSGPAYVFYFLEAMAQAGADMGLSSDQAYQLAVATFVGASHLAAHSSEPSGVLRERVTSKGGTTHAALESMHASGVAAHFIAAMRAAEQRATELGDEFGG
ncbi:pyrroline-5-carboxylate reductase [Variovorax sp. OV084]|jgi:pyrroline-5-carboxylate reductase|uniref:pyrroline-5-carboxylate reductase n=1 Tax=Variovorax sp. OV084 TaxID=1882777 RepID=UPI0008D6D76E|nr:pyrroline-5-carboxylate reductase [Variovorax sp. OV084]SEU22172.1 pyrroline-5-carboxylate reductase [Variovorax sp. OV084]